MQPSIFGSQMSGTSLPTIMDHDFYWNYQMWEQQSTTEIGYTL